MKSSIAFQLLGLSQAFRLNFLGFFKEPSPLVGALTQQDVFDVTNQTSAGVLQKVVPGIFMPSTLMPNAPRSSTFTIVYIQYSKTPKHNPNAILPVTSNIVEGKMTQWRFVQIPGEASAQSQYGVGIATDSILEGTNSLEGSYEGSLVLTASGDLEAQHRAVAHFAEPWGPAQIVDWFIEANGQQVDVYLAIDNRAYGRAFNFALSGNNNTDSILKALRPVVIFGDDSNRTAVTGVMFEPRPIADIPPAYRFRSSITTGGTTMPSGDWFCKSHPDVRMKVQPSRRGHRALEHGYTAYQLDIQSHAHLITNIIVDDNDGYVVSSTTLDSTKFQPYEGDMTELNDLEACIVSISRFALQQDDETGEYNLVLGCSKGNSLSWRRYVPERSTSVDLLFVATK